MRNPMGLVQQQMLRQMQQRNPQLYSQIQQMTYGKSEAELKEMAQNIAKERGIDLNTLAAQMGVKI